MAKKMTENERRLTKEINRLHKENERLRDVISSLEADLSLANAKIIACEEGDFSKYALEEIGFETTYETVPSLILIARWHCKSYEDRKGYLPIDTFSKAVRYLTENGFRVTEI